MRRCAKAYFVITIPLLLISVVVQFYFAALGIFGPEDPDLFVFHSINGQFVLPALALLAVIFAALAKAGARTVLLTALPILLVAVQILLFIIAGAIFGGGEENPTVGGAIILGLHAINALAILGVIITLVRRAHARAFGFGLRHLERHADARYSVTAPLAGAWLGLVLLQVIAWAGAGVLGAGVGRMPGKLRSAGIVVGAVAGLAASIGALAIAGALVSVDWAFGAEKLLIAGPIGVVSSLGGVAFVIWSLRHPAARRRRASSVSRSPQPWAPRSDHWSSSSSARYSTRRSCSWWSASGLRELPSPCSYRSGVPPRITVPTGALAVVCAGLLVLFTVFGPSLNASAAGAPHPEAGNSGAPGVSVEDPQG